MDAFRGIAEALITEAMKAGEFDNLPGKGKPLDLSDDSMVPEDLRMAYRMLKNAGCLPPELEAQQELVRMIDLMRNATSDGERKDLRRQVDAKLLRLNLGRKRPLSLEDFPEYREKIERKLSGDSTAGSDDKR